MSHKTPPALPAVGTLARSVCDYFHKHPTEELDSVDISVKFTTTISHVVEQLAVVVSEGLLNRLKTRKQNVAPFVYMAGPDLERAYEANAQGKATAQATPPQTTVHGANALAPVTRKKAGDKKATRFSMQLVQQVAELPLPADTPKAKPASPWEPLFEQLNAPGLAAVLPLDQLPGARLAIGRRRGAGKPGNFLAKAIPNTDTCGVWHLTEAQAKKLEAAKTKKGAAA